jgi:hypothetical protein
VPSTVAAPPPPPQEVAETIVTAAYNPPTTIRVASTQPPAPAPTAQVQLQPPPPPATENQTFQVQPPTVIQVSTQQPPTQIQTQPTIFSQVQAPQQQPTVVYAPQLIDHVPHHTHRFPHSAEATSESCVPPTIVQEIVSVPQATVLRNLDHTGDYHPIHHRRRWTAYPGSCSSHRADASPTTARSHGGG